MKTERRHALEENTLAKEINVWSDKFQRHGSTALLVLGVALIVYAGAALWRSHRDTQNAEAWDAYQAAMIDGDMDLKELRRVADSEEFAGTEMQEWAYVTWADRQLLLASQNYFSDRKKAHDRLTAIAAVYDQYATNAVSAEIRNRARLGLARVNEMEDHLEEARRNYGLVEGALGEFAARRAKELESPEAEADAKWLATAEAPRPPSASGPGTPGLRPGFEATQPPIGGGVGPGEESPIDSTKSLEDVLGGLGQMTDESGERYDGAATEKKEEAPAAESETKSDANAPAEDADAAKKPAE